MDFSGNAFKSPKLLPQVSDVTMSHANLVMACRWGWTSRTTDPDGANAQTSRATPTVQPASAPSFNNVRSKRFAPCQGRLYHQLLCSHRIRTDLVEDCGANCVDPFASVSSSAFYCNECVQAEAVKIWEERKAQHYASYPPMEQMTKEHYDQFYREHRQLETEYARDRKVYEMELKAKTQPSNVCSALEGSKEENEFATELESLSLSLKASNDDTVNLGRLQPQARNRVNLPNDASEQLHWDLNTLALERGSCGVEYSATQTPNGEPVLQRVSDEQIWRKPRK
ncbi:hypothetical protein BDU57DRAFT_519921 [Ampelomyces quisqualis]|uniref:Uncharacterized protein n=1 Tax=Ampelomyces quisqualis TaxID=50730 RepID=A0A6A5QGA0_AMPQU|nr:hypothetical protein BDU57DRAFT_519921 [Ampelomyces quisqualis]